MQDDKRPRSYEFPDPTPQNRRRRSDWVLSFIALLHGGGWFLTFAAFVLFAQARPQGEDFFTRIASRALTGSWNASLLRFAFWSLLCSLFCALFAFLLKLTRRRRKTDRIGLAIPILSAISLISFLVLAGRFGVLL